MGWRVCGIEGCNQSRRFNKKVSIHGFPRDENILRTWLELSRINYESFNAESIFICSDHFSKRSFKVTQSGMRYIHPYACPSIFPWNPSPATGGQASLPIPTRNPSSQTKRLKNVHKTARSAINRAHHYQQNKAFKSKKVVKVNLKPLYKVAKLQLEPVHVKLTSINQYIICFLCGGYLVDASTVTECLHTFCKSCIVQHVQKNITCPVCDALIHETNPLSNIRFDRTKQDIIYELLPQIPIEEQARAEAFYKSRNLPMPRSSSEYMPDEQSSARPSSPVDELVSLKLEYSGASVECNPVQPLCKKFIRVPGRATIKHVQKFLIKKLSLQQNILVDIVCSDDDEIIEGQTTLWNIFQEMNISNEQLLTLYYTLAVNSNRIS